MPPRRPGARTRPPIPVLPVALAAAAVALTVAVLASTSPQPAITFKDIAAEAGITFTHNMSKTGQVFMVETMGSGGGFVDFDRDGLLDVYLLDGAPLPGYEGPKDLHAVLYRNEGNGRFRDVTAETGTGSREYGQGVCAGDYDNDGYDD